VGLEPTTLRLRVSFFFYLYNSTGNTNIYKIDFTNRGFFSLSLEVGMFHSGNSTRFSLSLE
jgi:hypothetical protein